MNAATSTLRRRPDFPCLVGIAAAVLGCMLLALLASGLGWWWLAVFGG